MTDKKIQLTKPIGYDSSRMIFSKPVVGSVANSDPPINYMRINISSRHDNGSVGDLILSTGELFSFGVNENKDTTTNTINGWSLPICLYTRDDIKPEEKEWVRTFEDIIEQCKDHLIDVKDNIKQFDLDRSDLKKFNPLSYRRDENHKLMPDTPTLYAKLIFSKKQDKILSKFYDMDDTPLNPLDLIKKFCTVQAAVKIESIFIGNKISLQIKLYECVVKVHESGMKRLLSIRPEADSLVLTQTSTTAPPLGGDDSDDDAGSVAGSDKGDSDSEEEEEKAPSPKKPVRRVVKRVVRKA